MYVYMYACVVSLVADFRTACRPTMDNAEG